MREHISFCFWSNQPQAPSAGPPLGVKTHQRVLEKKQNGPNFRNLKPYGLRCAQCCAVGLCKRGGGGHRGRHDRDKKRKKKSTGPRIDFHKSLPPLASPLQRPFLESVVPSPTQPPTTCTTRPRGAEQMITSRVGERKLEFSLVSRQHPPSSAPPPRPRISSSHSIHVTSTCEGNKYLN